MDSSPEVNILSCHPFVVPPFSSLSWQNLEDSAQRNYHVFNSIQPSQRFPPETYFQPKIDIAMETGFSNGIYRNENTEMKRLQISQISGKLPNTTRETRFLKTTKDIVSKSYKRFDYHHLAKSILAEQEEKRRQQEVKEENRNIVLVEKEEDDDDEEIIVW